MTSISIYTKGWVLGAYLLTFVFLWLGMVRGGLLWFYITLAFFIAWDAGWLLTDEKARDRSASEMLASSTRARTYMSWFLTVYGAVLTFLLFQGKEADQKAFFALCKAGDLNPVLFVVPFALTGLSLLFFPIALGEGGADRFDLGKRPASVANITIVIWVVLAQKVAIFSFLYAVSRLLYFSWQRFG